MGVYLQIGKYKNIILCDVRPRPNILKDFFFAVSTNIDIKMMDWQLLVKDLTYVIENWNGKDSVHH